MFLNCPHCGGLVATDPATDQPPERCPRCAAPLRAAAVEPEPARVPEPAPAPVPAPAPAPALAATVAPPQPMQPAPIAVTLRIDTAPSGDVAPAPAPPTTTFELAAEMAPIAVADAEPAPGQVEILRIDAEPVADVDVDADVDAVAATPVAAPARATGAHAPTFARHRAAGARPTGWALPALAAGLLALLALQWLLADRARLAQDARWRPMVLRTCALLRCDVPAWREPAAFTVVDRDVRPHPTRPGVLRVSATFRNDARWAQAWPLLQLTLSDVDGRAEAARAFTPAEYLAAAPTQDGVASGQLASVRMDVVEPSRRVVSFAFDFR